LNVIISSLLIGYKRHNHQNIRYKDSQNTEQAENLLPEKPTLFVFEPLEEEILEGIGGPLIGEAIIKVLVVRVRFEPEFVRVGEEQSAEEDEDDDKAEGWLHFRLEV
jgi:hypothetical protein